SAATNMSISPRISFLRSRRTRGALDLLDLRACLRFAVVAAIFSDLTLLTLRRRAASLRTERAGCRQSRGEPGASPSAGSTRRRRRILCWSATERDCTGEVPTPDWLDRSGTECMRCEPYPTEVQAPRPPTGVK